MGLIVPDAGTTTGGYQLLGDPTFTLPFRSSHSSREGQGSKQTITIANLGLDSRQEKVINIVE